MTSDPVKRSVETVAGRTGLTADAVAILFILAGILIIVFPRILQYVLGILLIVAGFLWLVQSRQTRPPAAP